MRADKSLSPFEIRVYRHYRIVHGTRVALAFLLTFLIIRLFTIPESTWPLVTMVVIMGPISFWGNVVPRAFERIGGTVLGSILGLIALQLELISLPLMLVWCAAAMFLCGWLALGKKPYQGLLIGVTLAIVVGSPTGEIDTALWRSGDVILGSLLAMLFTGIWPQRAFIHWRIQLAKSLTEYNRVLYYPSSAEKIGQFSLPAVRMPYRALGSNLVLSLQCRENRPVFSACSPHAVSGLGF